MRILRNTLALLGWLAVSFSAGVFGSQFRPDAWYESLAKPAWNPPNAIFGPVWSLLYALMGVAAWFVWRQKGFKRAGVALGLFLGQLALKGPTDETVLDMCNITYIPKSKVLFTMDCAPLTWIK